MVKRVRSPFIIVFRKGGNIGDKKPVRVTGKDTHRLDRDKDGLGCELDDGED